MWQLFTCNFHSMITIINKSPNQIFPVTKGKTKMRSLNGWSKLSVRVGYCFDDPYGSFNGGESKIKKGWMKWTFDINQMIVAQVKVKKSFSPLLFHKVGAVMDFLLPNNTCVMMDL